MQMIVPIINRQKLKHPKNQENQDELIIPFTWPDTSETLSTNGTMQVKLLDANGRSLWSAPSSADEFAAPHEIKYEKFKFTFNDTNKIHEIHISKSNIIGREAWPDIMLVSLLYDDGAMDSVAEIIVTSVEPSALSTKINDMSLSNTVVTNYHIQSQEYQITVSAHFDDLDVPIYLTAQLIDNMKNIVIDEIPLFYYNECYASSLPIVVGHNWQQIKIAIVGETELGHSIHAEYKVYFTPGVEHPQSAVLSNDTPIIGEMTLGFIPWV